MAQKILHPKVLQLKLRASSIQYSNVSVDVAGNITEYPASDLDKRIVAGYGVTWGNKNDYGETFIKGAFSKSISERGPNSSSKMPIKFLNMHNQRDPISLFERLEENDIGLYFRTVAIDPIDSADRLLIQLRSKTINNFSIGWNYVWDKIEYDDKTDSLIIIEAELYEISPVALASDPETYCLRDKKQFDEASLNLNEEIEFFIKSIPRKDQLEARNLFTRQKSLVRQEPLDSRREALKNDKPTKTRSKIDYKYLKQNLK